MARNNLHTMLLLTGSALLSACGGGGGGVGSLPAPAPSPSPPPAPAPTPTPTPTPAPVTIFESPSPQTYASVSVEATVPGGNPWQVDQGQKLYVTYPGNFAIRYTADGYYEVSFAGSEFARLIHSHWFSPSADNVAFGMEGGYNGNPEAFFGILASRKDGYSYSDYGYWLRVGNQFGWAAFGQATPAGNIPKTGTATYTGSVRGTADIVELDQLAGGYGMADIRGAVTLNIDFAAATVGGQFSLFYYDPTNTLAVYAMHGSLANGSNGFQGTFATALQGQNGFTGLFTGPNTEEAIGAWAVPFTFQGNVHQAMGAWVAKKN